MSDSELTTVTIAHPLFWYINPAAVEVTALRGQTIEVNAEDYARGEKYGAFVGAEAPVADPVADVDKPASDKVDDIKAWVDNDPGKAQEALTAEQEKPEDDQRSTLVEYLEKILAGA